MPRESVDNKDSDGYEVHSTDTKEFAESAEHFQQAVENSNYHHQDVDTILDQISSNTSTASSNQCLVCNKTFCSYASLTIHLQFHTGERSYFCSRCNKSFNSLSSLTSHSRRHDASTHLYKCTVCPKSFVNPRELARHTRIHTGARPFVCTVCGKGFAQEGDLVKHNRVHTGERPYQCSDISCGRTFPSASNLRAHMRHVHNADSNERTHSCTVCDKKFILATHLRAHMRTHSCERAHTCNVCGKAFREAGTLRRHMTTHSSDRPYRCSECGKCFPIANNLTKHMRVHTGERPYSCQTCLKSFSSGSNLKTHQKSHTGERPYSCLMCQRSFSNRTNLRTHQKSHAATGKEITSSSVLSYRSLAEAYQVKLERAVSDEDRLTGSSLRENSLSEGLGIDSKVKNEIREFSDDISRNETSAAEQIADSFYQKTDSKSRLDDLKRESSSHGNGSTLLVNSCDETPHGVT